MNLRQKHYKLSSLRWPIAEDWRYNLDYGASNLDDEEILNDFMHLNEKLESIRDKCSEKVADGIEHHLDLVLLIDELTPYLEGAISFLET